MKILNFVKILLLLAAIILVSSCENVETQSDLELLLNNKLDSCVNVVESSYALDYNIIEVIDTNFNASHKWGNIIYPGIYTVDKDRQIELMDPTYISKDFIDTTMLKQNVVVKWYFMREFSIYGNEKVKANVCLTKLKFEVHRSSTIKIY